MLKQTRVRLLLVGLAIALFVLAPVAGVTAAAFTDIKGHWAEPYINALVNEGYIKGYTDNTFRPDRTISRAEFVTIIMNIRGLKGSTSGTDSFSDIKNHWARDLINRAVSEGIVVKSEYSGTFKPDQALKRSEAAAMMVRALGQSPSSGTITFADKSDVQNSIYRDYIIAAYNLGLITGYNDGTFRPFNLVTRAQACTMLSNFSKKLDTAPVSGSGILSRIVVGGRTYDYLTTPVYFKIGFDEVRITNLRYTDNFLLVNNNAYIYSLKAGAGYPDLIVNNNRYVVKSFAISGSNLVVVPESMRLNRLVLGELRYNPEYVKLYVGRAYGDYYLYDMEIVDQYTVRVDGKEIDLRDNSVVIAPGNRYYIVERVILSENDTALELTETDPVIYNRLTMSDIEDIYVGNSRLNMSRISRIDFIIDNTRYYLNEVTIDASGNFSVDNKTYKPYEVTMIIDGEYYTIEDIRIYDQKFTFYCKLTDFDKVRINSKYYDVNRVQIVRDGIRYDLDEVLVVKRNVVRIGGKQYTLDSSFKCRIDGQIHDIKQIDYDTNLNMVVIEVSESSTGSEEPTSYLFYNKGLLLQTSLTNPVYIYTGGNWRDFDDVTVLSPTSYSYKGTSYNLIGARIRIAGVEYEVVDTNWQGSTGKFLIHLEED
ncbi:MAG: S-layer homology domain-containing protein [Syntrophomonadaceae bacterium]|nr:S-layer homology domain-containing protein [Syntrophomonadaceae bacterium]